jgi:hypothetical protein
MNQEKQDREAAIAGKSAFKFGAGLGLSLATAISWTTNKSILWAILHGLFGWTYVVYYGLGFGR